MATVGLNGGGKIVLPLARRQGSKATGVAKDKQFIWKIMQSSDIMIMISWAQQTYFMKN